MVRVVAQLVVMQRVCDLSFAFPGAAGGAREGANVASLEYGREMCAKGTQRLLENYEPRVKEFSAQWMERWQIFPSALVAAIYCKESKVRTGSRKERRASACAEGVCARRSCPRHKSFP